MSDEINTTNEVWKTIAEKPLYSVSNLGRIRRDVPSRTHPSGILKPGFRKGYAFVTFYAAGIQYKKQVHTLVAEAFIGPRPDGHQINHKNGVKHDNRSDNLEWITASQNIRHSFSVLGKQAPMGETNGMAKLTDEQVRTIRKHPGTLREISEQHGQAWKHVTP